MGKIYPFEIGVDKMGKIYPFFAWMKVGKIYPFELKWVKITRF